MTDWLPDIVARPGSRYQAIADALAEDVNAGRLAAGSRLPTHRDLAFKLKVTVGTVTRAYAEAERRGLVAGEVGRGTYVLGSGQPLRVEPWPEDTRQTTINLAVCQPQVPGVAEALAAEMANLATTSATTIEEWLGYPLHSGLPTHRAIGARWLQRHGIDAKPESVLLIGGAQAGMAVAFAALTRPGDLVLTECLTYFGMKSVAASLGLKLEGVAIDDHGLIPDAFDAACRQGARALYTVPTLQNPTATIQPAERRAEIVAIARRYGVAIVEDDVFGFLVENQPPPLQTLAPDLVILLRSLSKSVAAGLRIGHLVAPPRLVPRLEAQIRALYYGVPQLMAEIASRWIDNGKADTFADVQRGVAAGRMALAKRILAPFDVAATPTTSLHLWLKLPDPWRREAFVEEARIHGVAVTGADAFAVGRINAPHAVRLGLCMPRNDAELIRGLSTLVDVLNGPAMAGPSLV
ncbi:MAG: PLP-dependent aminotransferase family protein [Azospirillaceae bacterium]|nr:PLP-dependent aminotransferase family protein [Azospirillaceae bacterium]